MRLRPWVYLVLALLLGGASRVDAQSLREVTRHRSDVGSILGAVQDRQGAPLEGVRILAVGAWTALAMTDARGRFSLALPAGRYALHAEHDGYLPFTRRVVDVDPFHPVERRITLESDVRAANRGPDTSFSEIAWRLRHLSRTVLRVAQHDPARLGLADRSSEASRPIAPAADGSLRDWHIRGSLSSGAASAWGLLGAYRTTPRPDTQVDLTAAFSSVSPIRDDARPAAAAEDRRAAAVRFAGTWSATSRLRLHHVLQVDRDDALAGPLLLSSETAVRFELTGRLVVAAAAGRRAAGLHAVDVLPTSPSEWRTVSGHPRTTYGVAQPTPQVTTAGRLGIERVLDRDGALAVGIEWYREFVHDQLVITAADPAGASRDYRATPIGDADVSGWRLRIATAVTGTVQGTVELTTAAAAWRDWRGALARPEQVDDLRAVVTWSIPKTATRVRASHRVSRARDGDVSDHLVRRRFALEVHQRTPVSIQDGVMTLFWGVSTGLHDRAPVSPLDELLSPAHPARVSTGLQVQF